MKKIKILLILFIVSFTFNINASAASTTLSVSSNNINLGEKFTVYVNMSSAAAWNIHVSSSGPVEGCSINEADTTSDALDTSKKFTVACTPTGEGVVTLQLSGDVVSATDGIAVPISGSSKVTVTKKEASSSEKNSVTADVAANITPNITPNINNNDNNTKKNDDTNNKSTNNNIKELSVDGYKLVKVNEHNYTLSVNKDITSINIKATAEDSKSKVTGIGKHDLNYGDNNIEVIVTSESGSQNKINIKVTRKQEYNLDDLDEILDNSKETNFDINLNKDNKITKQYLEKVKESKKIVNLNFYNENNILEYSWIIDGNKIDSTDEFITELSYESDNDKEISELSNYALGLYLNFKHSGSLPNGTKIKLYVGDKFNDGDVVNLYYYDKNNNKLDFVQDNIKVKDKYVIFDIDHCSTYFLTMSNINNIKDNNKEVSNKSDYSTTSIVILAAIDIFLLIVVILLIRRKLRMKKEEYY